MGREELGLIGSGVVEPRGAQNIGDHAYVMELVGRSRNRVRKRFDGRVGGTNVIPAESRADLAETLKQPCWNLLPDDDPGVMVVYLSHWLGLIMKGFNGREDRYLSPVSLLRYFQVLEHPRNALGADVALAADVLVRTLRESLIFQEKRE